MTSKEPLRSGYMFASVSLCAKSLWPRPQTSTGSQSSSVEARVDANDWQPQISSLEQFRHHLIVSKQTLTT